MNMSQNLVSSTRNCTLDVAKGIGIIFIILGHLVDAQLGVVFYICHVPLFFIISGYLYRVPDDNIWTYFVKLAKSILIPYFWYTLALILWAYIDDSVSVGFIFEHMILQEHFSVAWYLAALLFGKLFFTIICKCCKTLRRIMWVSWIIGIVAILWEIHIGIFLLWNLDIALVSLCYLSFGYFLKQKNVFKTIDDVGAPKLFMMLCFCSSLILTFYNSYFGYTSYDMFNNQYGLLILTIPAVLLGSMAIIMFSKYIQNNKILGYIGSNSIYFFLLHKPFFTGIASHICAYFNLSRANSVLDYFLIVLIGFVVSMVSCEISHQIIVAILKLYKHYKPAILVDK